MISVLQNAQLILHIIINAQLILHFMIIIIILKRKLTEFNDSLIADESIQTIVLEHQLAHLVNYLHFGW